MCLNCNFESCKIWLKNLFWYSSVSILLESITCTWLQCRITCIYKTYEFRFTTISSSPFSHVAFPYMILQVNVLQNCSSWLFSCSSFAIWVVMQKICVKWMKYNKQWKSSMNFNYACCYVCISIKIYISSKWYHNVFQNSSI